MSSQNFKKPNDGVGSGIKIFVVILTVITAVTFAVFFFKVVGKMTSSSKEKPWALQLKINHEQSRESLP